VNEYKIGSIVTGKITGIQRYGAFVELDVRTQGLIHISEITHGFVRDIQDFLIIGDEVEVRVISIDEVTGKISLSLRGVQCDSEERKSSVFHVPRQTGKGFATLKGKLSQWIEESK
jgi:general stress protein 13